ncbi:hypothetical protein [Streptomyces griseocarneus]|uniref:DUF4232 domain-containing protein n=1 Tax=Streptomyces griseocarneus TaxID=51201 RepID=A0ABX7RH91_9ACTN|nr:hypothetical protein [Streptomyces griseocarneus]QSY47580.1 hypothetical protein J3S04_20030 [Streptomyces griseocarneus]
MRHAVALAVAAVALLPFGARADEPTPGSSQGGSPAASAPAGYQVSTELPGRITVNKKTGNTSLTATVHNGGTKEVSGLKLKVVGFQGMRITSVEGCTAIPTGQLPSDSNSGFVCTVDKLAAGRSHGYRVAATFDLGKTGQICLPVTLGDGKTLLWQQGPVHFGTTDTSSDAPDTPLLLGTKNVPSGSAATPGARRHTRRDHRRPADHGARHPARPDHRRPARHLARPDEHLARPDEERGPAGRVPVEGRRVRRRAGPHRHLVPPAVRGGRTRRPPAGRGCRGHLADPGPGRPPLSSSRRTAHESGPHPRRRVRARSVRRERRRLSRGGPAASRRWAGRPWPARP